MAERGNSVFDKKQEKPSLVADIMGFGKGVVRGAASSYAGLADLVAMAPSVAVDMTKGKKFIDDSLAQKNAGLLTEALAKNTPVDLRDNVDFYTPEGLGYKLGQLAMPIGAKGFKSGKAYSKEVGVNVGVDAGLAALENMPLENSLIALGVGVGGATAMGKLRNKMIRDLGITPESQRAAKEAGLTVGQMSENPNALRAEAKLTSAPKTADAVAKFYKKQENNFAASVDALTTKMGSNNTKVVRDAFSKLKDKYREQKDLAQELYVKQMKEAAQFNDGAAGVAESGLTKRFAPTKPLLDELDSIIKDYETLSGGNKSLIKPLKEMQTNLKKGKGYFSLELFETEIKDATKKAKGVGTYKDITDPNQSKVIAARILDSLNRTLDEVIDNPPSFVNAKAAEQMQLARSTYKNNMKALQDMSSVPMNKLFDVANVYELQGDVVIDKISKMKPNDRNLAIQWMNQTAPEIGDTVKQEIINKLVASGQVTGAGSAAAKYDSRAFLRSVENMRKTDPYLLEFLYPDAKQRAAFVNRINEASKIANKAEFPGVTKGNEVVNAAGDLGAAVGGSYQVRLGTKTLFGGVEDIGRSLMLGDKDLFKALFQNEDITNKVFNTAINRGLVKSAGQENLEQAPGSPEQPTDIDALAEEFLKEKGLGQGEQSGGAAPSDSIPAPQPMEQPQQAPVEAPMQPENPNQLEIDAQEFLQMKRQQMQQKGM